jgi:hypothetical protein
MLFLTSKPAGLLLPGQLPAVAAAHPEAYTGFIDCCLQSPLFEDQCIMAVLELLEHAAHAVLDSQDLLSNTSAVAALASALTSLTKRAVQSLNAARLQAQSGSTAAAGVAPAAVSLLGSFTAVVVRRLEAAAFRVGSRGSDSQAAASAAYLAVLLARSLVQLAAAVEAVGPQLLFDCLSKKDRVKISWGSFAGVRTFLTVSVGPEGEEQQRTVDGQWRIWQLRVLESSRRVLTVVRHLGVAPAAAGKASAGGAVATSAAAAAAAAGEVQSGGTSSSSSSSSQQAKWGHLLQLQQVNAHWAAAAAAFDTKWSSYNWSGLESQLDSCTVSEAETNKQLFSDALQLLRVLAAAAPLTVVCNNPSCQNLSGVSEAAASCKACGRCRCRYCSGACQRADWQRHKAGCRALAAAGLAAA